MDTYSKLYFLLLLLLFSPLKPILAHVSRASNSLVMMQTEVKGWTHMWCLQNVLLYEEKTYHLWKLLQTPPHTSTHCRFTCGVIDTPHYESVLYFVTSPTVRFTFAPVMFKASISVTLKFSLSLRVTVLLIMLFVCVSHHKLHPYSWLW